MVPSTETQSVVRFPTSSKEICMEYDGKGDGKTDGSATDPGAPGRRRFWKRAGIAAAIGATLAGIGAGVFAHGGPGGGWGGPGGWHGRHLSPELRAKHLDLMVEDVLDGIDATADQKSRIKAIVAEMMKELQPLREQRLQSRREAMEILTRPTVDRGAIEALRVEKLKVAEEASKRFTQGIADIAEVLTPEQRKALAQKFSRHRGRPER
jgi:protein CpxP